MRISVSSHHFRLCWLTSIALLAACVQMPRHTEHTPRIDRLASSTEYQAPTPTLSIEEKHRLDALNAQLLQEQENIIEREAQERAMRNLAYPSPHYTPAMSVYGGYGWGRHPHYGFGLASPFYPMW